MAIDLSCVDASLGDILDFITERYQVKFEILPKVRDCGMCEKKITFQMQSVLLRNALNLLLRQYGLSFTPDHGTIVITGEDE